jgi:hypothetical protein
MANQYLSNGVSSTPISGRSLAFSRQSLVKRAFTAADLFTGMRYLEAPTVLQAAVLARVNPTYVHYARARRAERQAIEAGFIPLVPARSSIPKANGGTLPVINGEEIADSELVHLAQVVGVERMLGAAVAVENGMSA